MKLKSYLLLFFLITIITFILGVRYGQKVEQANKVINYLLSITPTPSPSPITPTPIKYATTEGKIWRIKFIYPSFLKIREDPTRGAIFFEP